MPIHICIAQINYHSQSLQRHVCRLRQVIENYRHADLIVFPELILQGHPSLERPQGYLHRKMKTVFDSISEDLDRFIRETDDLFCIGPSLRGPIQRFFGPPLSSKTFVGK